MVLQRNKEVHIYGTGRSGANITVSFSGQQYSSLVSPNGDFRVNIASNQASGPHSIRIVEQNNETVVLNNVMFGDIYVCSGQSNMDWNIRSSSNPEIETQESLKHPNVRLFYVRIHTSGVPESDFRDGISSGWQVPSIQISPGFSAVCWTFGSLLNRRLGIAIGLLHSSVGGSPIEMWMSRTAHSECNGTQPAQNYWNSMIHPLLGYGTVGGLWYQGESNAGAFVRYQCQFQAMVKDWRNSFSSNLLFLSVQLAGYNGDFREIRNVQYQLTSLIQNTGVATAVDLGHPTDIHPKNKRDVATRLELIAANKLYGQRVMFSGPIFSRVELNRNNTTITGSAYFTNFEGGFDFKNSDNCTTCCNQRNDIIMLVDSSNRFHNVLLTLSADRIDLIATNVPVGRIASARIHWTNFPQCVLVNRQTRLASPSHLFNLP